LRAFEDEEEYEDEQAQGNRVGNMFPEQDTRR
jgi:hypothetical protein